jgi:hypothetical protein
VTLVGSMFQIFERLRIDIVCVLASIILYVEKSKSYKNVQLRQNCDHCALDNHSVGGGDPYPFWKEKH